MKMIMIDNEKICLFVCLLLYVLFALNRIMLLVQNLTTPNTSQLIHTLIYSFTPGANATYIACATFWVVG